MYCYLHRDKLLVSRHLYQGLDRVPEERADSHQGNVYILNKLDPAKSRRIFCVSRPSMAFPEKEGIEMLVERKSRPTCPGGLLPP